MKKVLIPVDFSEQTEILCSYALAFAQSEPCELMLFHTFYDRIVIPDSTFPDTIDMNTMYNEGWTRELRQTSEDRMGKLQEELTMQLNQTNSAQITIHTKVTGGEIEVEIREFCHAYQPDLVVMGSRGEGKSVETWGRISTYIVNNVNAPVLVIPEIDSFLGFSNIMIAADLSEENSMMIQRTIKLLSPFHPKYHCVHFILHEKDRTEESAKFNQLQKEVISAGLGVEIVFELIDVTYNNQLAIDEFVQKTGVEMIAFQPHKRSWFYTTFSGKITKRNFFSTNIPLIAIPVHG